MCEIRQSQLSGIIDLIATDYHPRDEDYLEELRELLTPAVRTLPWPDASGLWLASRKGGESIAVVCWGHMVACAELAGPDGEYIRQGDRDWTFTGPLTTIIPDAPKEPDGIDIHCSQCNARVRLPYTSGSRSEVRIDIPEFNGWSSPPVMCPTCNPPTTSDGEIG